MSQPDEHQRTTSTEPGGDASAAQESAHTTPGYPPLDYSGPPPSQGQPPPEPHAAQYGGQSAYPVPPGYAAPGYPVPGYPAPGYGPGYPPNTPGAAPYGYPPYGYAIPRGAVRPGGATASAVLMFIQAAVVLFSTFYVLFFASLASSADPYGGTGDTLETEWTIIGILQLVSVGLLIFAGVQLLGGNANARTLTIVACAAQLILVLYWMVRISSLPDFEIDGGTFFFVVPLMYAVLPVVALPLGIGKQVTDYITARSGGRPMGTTPG